MTRKGMKHYGSDRTALYLSEKAEEFYSFTDPLNIWEYSVNGMNLYDISGMITAEALTAEQVNEMLEDEYDNIEQIDAGGWV